MRQLALAALLSAVIVVPGKRPAVHRKPKAHKSLLERLADSRRPPGTILTFDPWPKKAAKAKP